MKRKPPTDKASLLPSNDNRSAFISAQPAGTKEGATMASIDGDKFIERWAEKLAPAVAEVVEEKTA